MGEWIRQNGATAVVLLLIAAAVVAAVMKMVRDRKRGNICCGDCARCGQCDTCGKKGEDTHDA